MIDLIIMVCGSGRALPGSAALTSKKKTEKTDNALPPSIAASCSIDHTHTIALLFT
jgi:hypothetical protein